MKQLVKRFFLLDKEVFPCSEAFPNKVWPILYFLPWMCLSVQWRICCPYHHSFTESAFPLVPNLFFCPYFFFVFLLFLPSLTLWPPLFLSPLLSLLTFIYLKVDSFKFPMMEALLGKRKREMRSRKDEKLCDLVRNDRLKILSRFVMVHKSQASFMKTYVLKLRMQLSAPHQSPQKGGMFRIVAWLWQAPYVIHQKATTMKFPLLSIMQRFPFKKFVRLSLVVTLIW